MASLTAALHIYGMICAEESGIHFYRVKKEYLREERTSQAARVDPPGLNVVRTACSG